jgi:N-acetylglucosamine-6-phosphate deacetylase
MKTIIKNGTVILPSGLLKRSTVFINNSKILSVGKPPLRAKDSVIIDAKGAFVSPGFIDAHIHGLPEEIFLNERKYGTTSFVVAVSCGLPAPDLSGHPCALGVRLEGPFINPIMAGAQDRRYIKKPSVGRLAKILKRSGASLKMITLAPELEGCAPLIKACVDKGVIPSIGHSNATYEEAKKYFSVGIRHVTHIFNAISGPRHGSAGASMAALFDGRVTAEVIADLKHVRADLLRLLFALRNKERIVLITDSVRAGSSGHKNGSRLTMIKAVENVVRRCGVRLPDAVRMASLNPATVFGVARQKGSIASGKDADIVIFDENFDVKMTMIRGRIVYKKKGFVCAA